ncbi:hypothetical protein SDC9_85444 [bioreactor metagenome]|uniref:Uncharacterized protein n=1 Tax=bioreactor metagenome TaxID=1076179 RepID=A0A644ZM29_9ZZZZ
MVGREVEDFIGVKFPFDAVGPEADDSGGPPVEIGPVGDPAPGVPPARGQQRHACRAHTQRLRRPQRSRHAAQIGHMRALRLLSAKIHISGTVVHGFHSLFDVYFIISNGKCPIREEINDEESSPFQSA